MTSYNCKTLGCMYEDNGAPCIYCLKAAHYTFVLESDKTLYVDVDDTLVIWDHMHATYAPHKVHLAKIEEFLARGQAVVIWSAGGYAWAKRVTEELGLFGRVSAVLCKPVWWMDDLTADEVLLKSGHIYLKDE